MKAIDLIITDSRVKEWGIPSYAHTGDAGVDLYACIDEPITLREGETVLIKTGMAISIVDPSIVALLMPRSGLGHKLGLILGNGTGVIDSGYQGQVCVSACNRKHAELKSDVDAEGITTMHVVDHSIVINPGDKIAQMIFVPVIQVQFNVVDNFDASERADSGFGSTGV
jgi:dUTP pyrophosphatase